MHKFGTHHLPKKMTAPFLSIFCLVESIVFTSILQSVVMNLSQNVFVVFVYFCTGEKVTEVPCETPTFTVAWHPKKPLLAFACDDKDKYNRDRDAGTVKLFGLPSSSSSSDTWWCSLFLKTKLRSESRGVETCLYWSFPLCLLIWQTDMLGLPSFWTDSWWCPYVHCSLAPKETPTGCRFQWKAIWTA